MRKAIGLSYLNAEKEIPRCITPWISHVDYVIGVDGRYWTPTPPQMRGKQPNYSTDNSYDVLEKICGDKFIYDKFYGNQMDKRQRYLDIAGELGCDILIVMDSDETIHPDHQDWNRFDKQLEAVTTHWNDEMFSMWVWIPDDKLWPRQWNAGIPSNSWKKYVRIHRNPGEQRYTQNHWTFVKKEITEEQIYEWRWSMPNVENDPALQMENPYFLKENITLDGIRIRTDRTLRTNDQLDFGDGWAFQNMHWENFEFNVKPYVHHKGLSFEYEDLKKQIPYLEYYFDKEGYLIPYYFMDGELIIIKPDRTREVLQEALAS
jgi:hypothetical protein